MTKRINVSLSIELYEWLVIEAKKTGLPVSTMATVLLTEAKKTRENVATMKGMLQRMTSIDEETFMKMLKSEYAEMQLKLEG